MNEDKVKEIIREEIEKLRDEMMAKAIHPSQLTPKLIKQRHIEDVVIKRGLAANLPSDGGAVNVLAYFETDTGDLKIWDGSSWLETTLA